MDVKVLKEAGYEEALLGISLSYGADIDRMPSVAKKLANKDGGHNKFLESICVWLDIDAPRYWWSQFDTYRIGVTKQSESTMHTLTKQILTLSDFQHHVPFKFLDVINEAIQKKDLEYAKSLLPESFLQRRIVCTNYKALRGIVHQRSTHKLWEWKLFCNRLEEQVEFPEFIFNRRRGNDSL